MIPLTLVVAVALLGWGLYPLARMSYAEQRNRDRLEQQLAALRTRNADLKRQVDRLKTPAGIEDAARQLGLARKGEQVWVTTPASGTPTSGGDPGAVARSGVAPESTWTKALDALFGVKE